MNILISHNNSNNKTTKFFQLIWPRLPRLFAADENAVNHKVNHTTERFTTVIIVTYIIFFTCLFFLSIDVIALKLCGCFLKVTHKDAQ